MSTSPRPSHWYLRIVSFPDSFPNCCTLLCVCNSAWKKKKSGKKTSEIIYRMNMTSVGAMRIVSFPDPSSPILSCCILLCVCIHNSTWKKKKWRKKSLFIMWTTSRCAISMVLSQTLTLAAFTLLHICIHSSTVDPRLPDYNGTRPWPDKWNSWICESSCNCVKRLHYWLWICYGLLPQRTTT